MSHSRSSARSRSAWPGRPAAAGPRSRSSGREHDLRQTLIALTAGRALGEHEAPGEATLQVLSGRVRLHAGEDSWEGGDGDYLIIPPVRHDLEAVTDAVVLLTVASRAGDAEAGAASPSSITLENEAAPGRDNGVTRRTARRTIDSVGRCQSSSIGCCPG